jgi:hypothetical protein
MNNEFPKNLEVPSRLPALIAFCKKTGDFYPAIELKTESASAVAAYFGTHASADFAAQYLGVFAGGPDGSSYAVWRAPQGGFPVVLLGSEGDNQVLASSFDQFLSWLSIRDTAEFEEDEDSADDDEDQKVRKAFRVWLKAEGLKPPKSADAIDKACLPFSNFADWCDEAVAGTLSAQTHVAPINVKPSAAEDSANTADTATKVGKDNAFAALVECMGQPIDGPQCVALLAYLGKPMKPATLRDTRTSVNAEAFGIELAATCTPNIRSLWPARKVGKVYVTYMSAAEIEPQFASPLPHGLTWGQAQADVEKLCRPRKLTYKIKTQLLDLPIGRDDVEVLPRYEGGKLASIRIALAQELEYITANADYEKTKPLVYVEDAFFATWCALNGLLDDKKFGAAVTEKIRKRDESPLAFLHGACGRLLWSNDLTEQGLAFVRVYYSGFGLPDEQRWVRDVSNIFGSSNHFRNDDEQPTPDDWKSFDKIAPRIAQRFGEWRAGKLIESF